METPQDLIFDPKYVKASKRDNICIIAHSRYATVGDLTDELCHPFKFKNVAGCHNGTILPLRLISVLCTAIMA